MSTHPSPPAGSPVVRVIDCHVARTVGSTQDSPAALEFLLLRRARGRIYEGTWRMVGGKIDVGETAWKACLRELLEETGLAPQRLLSVPYVNQFYEWKHDRINAIPVFVAVVADDPRLDGEHDAFEWLSVAHACERLAWPGQRDGLLAAADLLLRRDSLQQFMEIPLHDDQARA